MISEYATNLATQMGVSLDDITLSNGHPLGVPDTYLLSLHAQNKLACEFVRQAELDSLQSDCCSDFLEMKVRAALARLKMLLEP